MNTNIYNNAIKNDKLSIDVRCKIANVARVRFYDSLSAARNNSRENLISHTRIYVKLFRREILYAIYIFELYSQNIMCHIVLSSYICFYKASVILFYLSVKAHTQKIARL